MRKAASSSTESFITEFDLYDLLGIDSSSDQSEIKKAYRSLQKRCHPDIAGPAGHDMAILLNQIYALLSDPVSRFAYDKEQAKIAELRGYTGKPLYSAWLGPETEQRAVFVDEVKCVGCLKCALLADKTFAIESVYGRARVIAQWADPEPRIQQSIDACPVNCISMVERSDLAALEFLMSKQPRPSVRIGASNNTGGARVFDVFSEVRVFYKRLEEARNRKSYQDPQYPGMQIDARMSAIQAIRSISNWLYWKSPVSETPSNLTLVKGAKTSFEPDIEKLRDAARKHATLKTGEKTRFIPQTTLKDEEYWTPSAPVLPLETKENSNARNTVRTPTSSEGDENIYNRTYVKREASPRRPLISGISMGLAIVAASIVRLQIAGEAAGGLEEHIGGSIALEVVNSSWLQVILAGATWYFIGLVVTQLVERLISRGKM